MTGDELVAPGPGDQGGMAGAKEAPKTFEAGASSA